MHDKCPLPRGEGTLGIDRAFKSHNSLLTEVSRQTSASRENTQHRTHRKPTATRQKVHYSEKKKENLVTYIRWNTYMSYIRHFPAGIIYYYGYVLLSRIL